MSFDPFQNPISYKTRDCPYIVTNTVTLRVQCYGIVYYLLSTHLQNTKEDLSWIALGNAPCQNDKPLRLVKNLLLASQRW
jgi:hypothetical protein